MSNTTPTNEMYEMSEKEFITNDLLDVLQERGLIPDVNITEDKIAQAKQKKAKREFRNTELLLKQYRNIVAAVSILPQQIAYELNIPFKSVDELIEKADLAYAMGDETKETEIKSIKRTKQLIDVVNKALTDMKIMSEEGHFFYKLIYFTYINKKRLNGEQLAEILGISIRTYYRKKKEAIELFSSLLWKSPNRELDTWLDIVAILSEEGEDKK